jgi:hypothetical protein
MALQSTTALATIVLQQASSTVTFSGIPSTYRDLFLVIQTLGTTSSYDRVRINNESGSVYTRQRIVSNSAGASAQSTTLTAIDLNDINTSSFSLSTLQFLDANATNKHKTVLVRTSQLGAAETTFHVARVATTTAIGEISVFANSGSFAATSSFALFGRIA